MKLEDQVTSLELSKKLHELGVKQDSLFYYQNNPYNDGTDCMDIMIKEVISKNNENNIINTECENDKHEKYAAFTVGELGEMIPERTDKFRKKYIKFQKSRFESTLKDHYLCSYVEDGGYNMDYVVIELYDENEANSRAKMLIYLIENKLIEIPK